MDVLSHHHNWILVMEWNNACAQFIEQDPQCIDIAAIAGGKSLGLFRRDIEWITILYNASKLSKAEIGKQWLSYLELQSIVSVEKNIAWFNIAMDDAMLMGSVNRSTQACEKIGDVSKCGGEVFVRSIT
jgi:hypothetical protein